MTCKSNSTNSPTHKKLFHTCFYYDNLVMQHASFLSLSLCVSLSLSLSDALSVSLFLISFSHSLSLSLFSLSQSLYLYLSPVPTYSLSSVRSFFISIYLSFFLSFFFLSFFFLSFSPHTQRYPLINKLSVPFTHKFLTVHTLLLVANVSDFRDVLIALSSLPVRKRFNPPVACG